MYTIDSYQNNLKFLPFVWRLLHFEHFSIQMSGWNLSYYRKYLQKQKSGEKTESERKNYKRRKRLYFGNS